MPTFSGSITGEQPFLNEKPWPENLEEKGCPLGGHPRFHELTRKMSEVHAAKSHDYSGRSDPLKNFKTSEDMGVPAWVGALIRTNDKMERCKNFAKQQTFEVKGESVKDTLLDLANYALLVYILYEEFEAALNNEKV